MFSAALLKSRTGGCRPTGKNFRDMSPMRCRKNMPMNVGDSLDIPGIGKVTVSPTVSRDITGEAKG